MAKTTQRSETMNPEIKATSASETNHAQQRARSAHANMVKGTQGLAMSRSWHINKDNDLALKPFVISNLRKANGMTIHIAR